MQALSAQLQPQAAGDASINTAASTAFSGATDQKDSHELLDTPGQTTRFGRVSRPPVAAPLQNQLAMLQQILGVGTASQPTSNIQDLTNIQSGPSHRPRQTQSLGQTASPSASVRPTTAKRPPSALRDHTIPQLAQPGPPRNVREESPLVRPAPTATIGRPKRGEVISKEERLERRRVQNSQSGQSQAPQRQSPWALV